MARSISARDLQLDYRVFTSDGEHLGSVKEIRREAFKIDAPWQRDYWVSADHVMTVVPGDRVVLDVVRDDLDKRDSASRGPVQRPTETLAYGSRQLMETDFGDAQTRRGNSLPRSGGQTFGDRCHDALAVKSGDSTYLNRSARALRT